GIFLGEERAPHTGSALAAERTFAVHAGEHVLHHRVEKRCLEILRRRPGLGPAAAGDRARRRRIGDPRRHVARAECRGLHHITSISAWMAPAALMACRMAIRSRGPMPSAFSPSTTCCSDTPSRTMARRLPSSCTPTRLRGTTRVWPCENGAGWLT